MELMLFIFLKILLFAQEFSNKSSVAMLPSSPHKIFHVSGPLQPSRRRSLFTLATSMIIFSSKIYSIIPLLPCAKTALTEKTVCAIVLFKDFLQLFIHCTIEVFWSVNFGSSSQIFLCIFLIYHIMWKTRPKKLLLCER